MLRSTPLVALCLPALALISPIRPQDGGSVKVHRAAATVSCPTDGATMSADQLQEILQSEGFLASVFPSLTPGNSASVLDTPQGVFCNANQVAGELVAISVFAAKADVAKSAIDELLKALPKLRPGQAADAARSLEIAKRQRDEAEQRLRTIEDAMGKFVETHGSIEPSVFLASARDELASSSQQLSEARFDLAMQQSLRDSLDKQLATIPTQVEVRRVIPSMKRQLVERQLNAIPNVGIESIQEVNQLLTLQLKLVDDLEKRLASGEFEDKVVVAKEENSRRQEVQNQLFDVEVRLAETKSREAALTQRVELLRTESMKYWKLDIQWGALQAQLDSARNARNDVSNVLADAERMMREASYQRQVVVVSGPQVD